MLLGNAVKKQLIADVPVGLMLSGGVDSSLIVATASKYFDKLNTFTVTFPDLQKYDESKHAQLIAKHFNTNHVELNAEEVEPEIFYKLVKHYDEPMVDSSMIPTYLLSKEIRKHCKVALGGDGADDITTATAIPEFSTLLMPIASVMLIVGNRIRNKSE